MPYSASCARSERPDSAASPPSNAKPPNFILTPFAVNCRSTLPLNTVNGMRKLTRNSASSKKVFQIAPFEKGIMPDLTRVQGSCRVLPMMTLSESVSRFPDEETCYQYLVDMRWPNGVYCPRCGNTVVSKLSKPFRWQCRACQKNGYRFSPLVGTIFENTNYPLRTGFRSST